MKIDKRVDTEIANKILRTLGIRSNTEDARVETEPTNGKTTRRMHATMSKTSAEQITRMTFTAHDEGLITPIKITSGGTSSAEPIEVDGSGKEENENDVEVEDADISPSSPKLETPKTKAKREKR